MTWRPYTHRRARLWTALAVVALLGAASAGGARWREQSRKTAVAIAITGGDPERGLLAIRRYGCGGCHAIAGAPGADGKVAQPLEDLRQRVYIGGVLRNTPDDLVRWIVTPRAFAPRTAMPATGIGEAEARDVAAYLYAH